MYFWQTFSHLNKYFEVFSLTFHIWWTIRGRDIKSEEHLVQTGAFSLLGSQHPYPPPNSATGTCNGHSMTNRRAARQVQLGKICSGSNLRGTKARQTQAISLAFRFDCALTRENKRVYFNVHLWGFVKLHHIFLSFSILEVQRTHSTKQTGMSCVTDLNPTAPNMRVSRVLVVMSQYKIRKPSSTSRSPHRTLQLHLKMPHFKRCVTCSYSFRQAKRPRAATNWT